MSDSHLPVKERLLTLLIAAVLALLALKIFFAVRLDLYSDEIYYWLASTRLALAYSDLPFMTAFLSGLGSSLSAGSPWAVRAVFLALGTAVPALVYWLARPVTGHRQALYSALLAVCIPLGGFVGLLAVPDVPLLFFGLLSAGCFERALRTSQSRYWIATGLFAALGLSTHYRFFLYPLAAVLFLLFFRPARIQWRNPMLWVAAGVASLGLIPVLWFNLSHELASASFYLVERHPWTFQPAGLLHLLKQAGLVTPPLYGLLLFTLWYMIQQGRKGDQSAALLASLALVNLLVYMVLAPWTDASSTSIHWPLSGYFPILVYAPSTLHRLHTWAAARWGEARAEVLSRAIPLLGFAGAVVAILAIGSQSYQTRMQALVGSGLLSNKMAGWREFSTNTRLLLADEFGADTPIVVTDNYYTAAQLLFADVAGQVYTLDQDKAVRDGRELQMRLWDMGEAGLVRQAGQPFVYITEDSTLTVPDKEQALGAICRHAANLDYLTGFSLYGGDKMFSYYTGQQVIDAPAPDYRARPCPFPPRGWIDQPVAGAVMRGAFRIQGWAYNEDLGLREVHVLLNGMRVAELNYGIVRPDVVQAMNVTTDPNAPGLGFDHELDTTQFANGRYEMAIEMVDSRGVSTQYGARQVEIDN